MKPLCLRLLLLKLRSVFTLLCTQFFDLNVKYFRGIQLLQEIQQQDFNSQVKWIVIFESVAVLSCLRVNIVKNCDEDQAKNL